MHNCILYFPHDFYFFSEIVGFCPTFLRFFAQIVGVEALNLFELKEGNRPRPAV